MSSLADINQFRTLTASLAKAKTLVPSLLERAEKARLNLTDGLTGTALMALRHPTGRADDIYWQYHQPGLWTEYQYAEAAATAFSRAIARLEAELATPLMIAAGNDAAAADALAKSEKATQNAEAERVRQAQLATEKAYFSERDRKELQEKLRNYTPEQRANWERGQAQLRAS